VFEKLVLIVFVGLFHPVWMNMSPLIRGG